MKTDSSIRSTVSAISPVAGQTGGRNNPEKNYSIENVALDTATRPQENQREKCAERAQLAHAVAQAVLSLNACSREYQDARDREEDPEQISIALTAAREAKRAAVHAYDEHIKKHGCSRRDWESMSSEERRLLAAYETATRLYSSAVSELARQRGVLPLDAYNQLREGVEQARINCEKARLTLQNVQSGKQKAE